MIGLSAVFGAEDAAPGNPFRQDASATPAPLRTKFLLFTSNPF
jgi:hypothetical protein